VGRGLTLLISVGAVIQAFANCGVRAEPEFLPTGKAPGPAMIHGMRVRIEWSFRPPPAAYKLWRDSRPSPAGDPLWIRKHPSDPEAANEMDSE